MKLKGPSEGACFRLQSELSPVPFQNEQTHRAGFPMQCGKYGPARCTGQSKVVDLKQFVSCPKSFDSWIAIFLHNTANKISFRVIPRFKRHSHLVEVMRVKVAFSLPIGHV